jgi:hypothetical protein
MRTRPRPALTPRSAFAGFRFPPDAIVLAVRWYLRFSLSYRDLEELLAERGVEVDHVTVYRWCSGSRRCWLTPLGHAGMVRGLVALALGRKGPARRTLAPTIPIPCGAGSGSRHSRPSRRGRIAI